MQIVKNRIVVGSRVKLIDDVDMGWCIYTKGHEFNVTGQTRRGFDLQDDDGNKIGEVCSGLELVEPINIQENIQYPDSNKILHALSCLKHIGVDRVHVPKEQYDQWTKVIDPRLKEDIQQHFILGIEITEHDA